MRAMLVSQLQRLPTVPCADMWPTPRHAGQWASCSESLLSPAAGWHHRHHGVLHDAAHGAPGPPHRPAARVQALRGANCCSSGAFACILQKGQAGSGVPHLKGARPWHMSTRTLMNLCSQSPGLLPWSVCASVAVKRGPMCRPAFTAGGAGGGDGVAAAGAGHLCAGHGHAAAAGGGAPAV